MDTLFDIPLVREDNLLRRFEEIHDFIYAHDGLSPRETLEEFIKILFIKIFDEDKKIYKFYLSNDSIDLSSIAELFEFTKMKFNTVFEKTDKINLSHVSLEFVVKKFKNISLNDSSNDVKGLAFQKFLGHHEKADRGQFFTPEQIIDFCVKIIDPQKHEKILDPACGSGGFLVSSLKYLQKNNVNLDNKAIINNNLFGIDINRNIARIAKMKLLLEQNTHSNIIVHNSLEPIDAIKSLLNNGEGFDIILTNPPFGAKLNQQSLLSTYQLGFKWNKTHEGFMRNSTLLNTQTVETLFIERCLEILKVGGRMAIVLPNGNLENSSLEYIRYFIMKKAKILAVINLPQETFIPYGTGVKTSILFLEKKDDANIKHYSIFFGKITRLGYQGNKNGTPMYKKNEYGQYLFDSNGNQIIDEDINDLIQLYKKYRDGKLFDNSKAFSIDSVKIESRLDFDFYSPETRNLFMNINNHTAKLGDICEIVRTKSSKLRKDTGLIEYIELSDINTNSFEIINATPYNVYDLPSRASFEIKEGDIITAVAGNSVGTRKHATALVSKKYSGCICTNGFRIIRNSKINPYFLLFYMKNEKFLKQMYMLRTGAAIPSVSDSDIKNIIIEIPRDKIMDTIVEKMQKIFSLRNKAQEEFESINKTFCAVHDAEGIW
ncbi:MAG: N-6 DNA methylase [Bacteroidales bacterium]|jgi:type I restriction enzyme M protein|nr:N-6 DNA methylase [Bacteroidales bacterium]